MSAPLTASELLPDGALRRLGAHVVMFGEVDSTNAYLLQSAESLPDGTIAIAEFQRVGRGRLGRRWIAPRGSSLLLSGLLVEGRPPGGSTEATALRHGLIESHATLAAVVATCEAIETTTDCGPGVRWPNDIVCRGRKLGGVLAEARPLSAGRRAIVIGVGLNCLQQRGHFDAELAERATSLEIESPKAINRRAVAAALLLRLDTWIAALELDATGPDRLRSMWRRRCVDLGERVTLQHDARSYSGTVLDISEDGDLDVQLDLGGRRRFGAATTTRNG